MANHEIRSPNTYARMGGIAYLIIIIAGAFGELSVRGSLVVSGNAAATSNNIINSTLLWRMGIAGDLVMHICDVIVITVFYVLFKPVHRNIALLAVLFNLVQTSVLVANKINLLTPLFLSGNANYLQAFTPAQLQALTYLSIKTHSYGFSIGLIFFGMQCLAIGYLITKSNFLPKFLGILMLIAGFCYLSNSFILIIAPDYSSFSLLIPAFIAELLLSLWLVIKGVNVSKWNAKIKSAEQLF